MIYLDTTALVKLVRLEAESGVLIAWINSRAPEPLLASALIEIELPRALGRSQPGVPGGVAPVLARIHRVEINAAVRATAGTYADQLLRSLDAIHLATAEILIASGHAITAFVTYDKRLADAAGRANMPVIAPGWASAPGSGQAPATSSNST